MRILYGPIDSWRFGRSLGVDPLAAKHKLCPVVLHVLPVW